jgi:hypothetical protein
VKQRRQNGLLFHFSQRGGASRREWGWSCRSSRITPTGEAEEAERPPFTFFAAGWRIPTGVGMVVPFESDHPDRLGGGGRTASFYIFRSGVAHPDGSRDGRAVRVGSPRQVKQRRQNGLLLHFSQRGGASRRESGWPCRSSRITPTGEAEEAERPPFSFFAAGWRIPTGVGMAVPFESDHPDR